MNFEGHTSGHNRKHPINTAEWTKKFLTHFRGYWSLLDCLYLFPTAFFAMLHSASCESSGWEARTLNWEKGYSSICLCGPVDLQTPENFRFYKNIITSWNTQKECAIVLFTDKFIEPVINSFTSFKIQNVYKGKQPKSSLLLPQLLPPPNQFCFSGILERF